MDYWTEHASIAMDEAGITATSEQLDKIAAVIESAHEFYGQMHGHDVADANFRDEQRKKTADAERALKREQDKVFCRECNGNGYTIVSYGSRSGESQCWKCGGAGRHDP